MLFVYFLHSTFLTTLVGWHYRLSWTDKRLTPAQILKPKNPAILRHRLLFPPLIEMGMKTERAKWHLHPFLSPEDNGYSSALIWKLGSGDYCNHAIIYFNSNRRIGGPSWDWTRDLTIMSRLLYHWAKGPIPYYVTFPTFRFKLVEVLRRPAELLRISIHGVF